MDIMRGGKAVWRSATATISPRSLKVTNEAPLLRMVGSAHPRSVSVRITESELTIRVEIGQRPARVRGLQNS